MKVRRISERQGKFHFPDFDSYFERYLNAFNQTDLGAIHQAIPWDELIKTFEISESFKGPDCIFSPRGKIGLMFLKNYTSTSDKKLIEQLNGNIYFQIFCDLILDPGEIINNFKIVSQIRCELAGTFRLKQLENDLMKAWKPYMKDLNSITCDATCYESSIKYPTDVKLLFDAVVWMHDCVLVKSKLHGLRKPRTKFNKWVRKSISYSKMKKKRKKKRRSVTRGLLRLLKKLVEIMDTLEQEHGKLNYHDQYLKRRSTIKTILEQQSGKFFEGKRPKQAIVSIDKPHIRPIVRGKENKGVEFGAKVHKLQIDGISFIEHLSFEAFNEGTRLEKTIWRAQKLTGKKVKLLGADAIYATNANRNYVTKRGIQTDFKPKGRSGRHKEHKSQITKMITKARASSLEGSFGTDKEYFLLNKIKARTKETEMLWIFFGIHTSNALNIGRRMRNLAALAA